MSVWTIPLRCKYSKTRIKNYRKIDMNRKKIK